MAASSALSSFTPKREMSVRDMVRAAQAEMRASELQPSRARELLHHLTALIGNVNAESREADMAYNVVLLRHLDSSEAANRATIRAQTTPEYLRKREADDTKKEITQSVMSLKKCIDSLSDEMRLSR